MSSITVIVEMVNRFTRPFKKMTGDLKRFARVRQITDAYRDVSRRFGNVTAEAGKLTKRLGLLGLTGGGV